MSGILILALEYKTIKALKVQFRPRGYWRGHQTSPTMVSLRKRQTTCSLNPLFLAILFRYTVCFVMVFLYKNRIQNSTEIEKYFVLM